MKNILLGFLVFLVLWLTLVIFLVMSKSSAPKWVYAIPILAGIATTRFLRSAENSYESSHSSEPLNELESARLESLIRKDESFEEILNEDELHEMLRLKHKQSLAPLETDSPILLEKKKFLFPPLSKGEVATLKVLLDKQGNGGHLSENEKFDVELLSRRDEFYKAKKE